MGIIKFDRYQVIMHPLRAMTGRTTTKAVLTNVFIWICKLAYLSLLLEAYFNFILHFIIKVSTILCLPFAYFRLVEEFSNGSVECVNSEQLENLDFYNLNLDQMLLIYKITISYVIPLSTIIVCYIFMFSKLNNRPNVFKLGPFFI